MNRKMYTMTENMVNQSEKDPSRKCFLLNMGTCEALNSLGVYSNQVSPQFDDTLERLKMRYAISTGIMQPNNKDNMGTPERLVELLSALRNEASQGTTFLQRGEQAQIYKLLDTLEDGKTGHFI